MGSGRKVTMENILVLGSNGMLGYGVSEYFRRGGYSVINSTKADFDVLKNDFSELEPLVKNLDVVINCIGVIKPMIDKYSQLEVLKINGIFPRNLALLCESQNTPLIHVTTDCAYTGRKGSYNEKDQYDAEDLYGISKNCGDIANCMTLRTSFIGPENGRGRSLLEWAFAQKGKTISGYTNHLWNGVSTVNFARIAEKIILEGLYEKGIFHIFSADTITKLELVSLFNEIFSLSMTINAVEGPEFCDRSLSSIYPLSGKVSVLTVQEQVQELKEFFGL